MHNSHTRFKVGLATHPLRRWAQLQPHSQTDFDESLVFDVSSEVSASWAEKTVHRAIVHANLSVPSLGDGHTEWFDYAALDVAHTFAREHRMLLGISDGYTLSAPSDSSVAPALRQPGTAGSGSSYLFTGDPVDINAHVGTRVQRRVAGLIATKSLIGSAPSGDELILYFRRSLVAASDLIFHPDDFLCSALDLRSGHHMRARRWIFGGTTVNAEVIRLSVHYPFYLAQALDTIVDPSAQRLGRPRTWEQTTPGIERLRTALRSLIASAPVLPG